MFSWIFIVLDQSVKALMTKVCDEQVHVNIYISLDLPKSEF
jgi:hypothetical protein